MFSVSFLISLSFYSVPAHPFVVLICTDMDVSMRNEFVWTVVLLYTVNGGRPGEMDRGRNW